jgi:tetratricopeptide (TPR) repeat protein/DNA-binding CsgD family transcriptional regulator
MKGSITINGIDFTRAEAKVLSCLSCNYTHSKIIGSILGSSPKTINTHIENIKRKIKVNKKNEIISFIENSNEIGKLQVSFNMRYVDYQYSKVAKVISHSLSILSIQCFCNVSPKITQDFEINDVFKAIEALNINLEKVENLQDIISNVSGLEPHKIGLLVVKNTNEITHFRNYLSCNRSDIIYICLDKQKTDCISDPNVLFYYDKKQLYNFLISYLIEHYSEINALDQEVNLLDSINTIELGGYSSTDERQIKNAINKKTKDIDLTKNSGSANLILTPIFSNLLNALYEKNARDIILFVACIGFTAIFLYKQVINKKTPILITNQSNLQKLAETTNTLAYNLPTKNINFVGREHVFRTILNNFNKGNIGVIVQSAIGSGGIGKTQLLTEYVYRAIHNNQYDIVLWINANSLNGIDNSYGEFANKLKIDVAKLNFTSIRNLVHDNILTKLHAKKVLIVLDDVIDQNNIQWYLSEIKKQFPINIKTHVLISSRSQHWTDFAVMLDVFSEQEAKQLVKQYLPYEKEEKIVELIRTLNLYPLALGQAVGYIREHTNITDYLVLYNKMKQKYLDLKSLDFTGYRQTLWGILSITLANLSNEARDILSVTSYLAPNNISLDCFSYLPVEQKVAAIKELRKYSLITMNGSSSFKIHTLLQEIVRMQLKDQNKLIDKVIMLSKQDLEQFDLGDQATWSNARKWLSHISVLYNYTDKTIYDAQWLEQYGTIARHFGLYELARKFFTYSLNIKIAHYRNNNHIRLTDTLDSLSEVELQLDNYDISNEYCRKSLAIKEEYYKSSNNINAVNTLITLGKVKSNLGQYNNAKKILHQALNIQEKHYNDPNDIQLVETLFNIGDLELYFGYYELAQAVFQRILDIKNHYYHDPKHIGLSDTLNDLGLVELYLGNWRDSKRFHTKALEIRRKYYQRDDSILMVRSLHNLGVTEWGLGNYEKSKKLYMQSLQTKQEHYQDENHITLVTNLLGLGLSEYSQGNYEKAKYYLERDLAIRNSYYRNPNHVKLASSLHTLGIIDEALGNYDNALKNVTKSYDIRKDHYKNRLHNIMASEYSPVILWPRSIKSKNKLLTIKYYQDSLEITKKLFGKNHHFVARYYFLLANAYEDNKHYEKAISNYRKALLLAKRAGVYIKDATILSGHKNNIALIEYKLSKLIK